MVALLIMVMLLLMLLTGMVDTNGIGVHAVIGGCQRGIALLVSATWSWSWWRGCHWWWY